MIPPRNPYMKFACAACGWSFVSVQRSDVIVGPTQCERCRSDDLEIQASHALEMVASVAAQFLKRRGGHEQRQQSAAQAEE